MRFCYSLIMGIKFQLCLLVIVLGITTYALEKRGKEHESLKTKLYKRGNYQLPEAFDFMRLFQNFQLKSDTQCEPVSCNFYVSVSGMQG